MCGHYALAAFMLLMIVAGCSAAPRGPVPEGCSTGRTISAEDAIGIMLRAKQIRTRDDYEISVDKDKLGYLVVFSTKDESAVPSDGTVVVNFCGDVEAIIAPL